MNTALIHKTLNVTPPAAIVDNAGFTTATVDALGARWVIFKVFLGALDIAIAAFKLRESNDSGMSGAVDVPNADFSAATQSDGSTAASLPSATADNGVYAIHVPMLGRKRYLDLTLTGGDGSAGTYGVVSAELHELEVFPNNATERGFAQELIAG